MKTVLVTGGAGYIGSHTVKELLRENYNVLVFDNLFSGKKKTVLIPAKLIKGDLLNINKLKTVFKNNKIDAVIHFAGLIEAGESMKVPLEFYQNNVLGSLNLLRVMKDNKVKKIIFSSSAAVYGEPKEVPILENSPLLPINCYGSTKLMVEEILKYFDIAYNIKSISLRYFNAAGADPEGKLGEDHNPETHLIPNILKSVINNKCCYIFGDDYKTKDGTCIRDYIHVTDLAKAHILALKYLNKNNISDIFNLGNQKGISILEILNKVKKITGVNFKIKIIEKRPGDPAKLIASSKKAKKILKWEPKYSDLDTIIRTAWNWYKGQK